MLRRFCKDCRIGSLLIELAKNKYKFTNSIMKLRQIYIALTFALLFAGGMIAQAATGFSDVPSTNVNYKAIMDLKAKGVISGYPDGTFKPDQVVNRVEALKIMLGAANVSVVSSSKKAVFSDTDSSQWYAPYLNKAVELKIVAGYPDGTFKPTQTVNLVENLKILILALGVDVSKLDVPANPYADAPKDQWYAQYLQYAKNAHLIDADASGNIQPAQGMTRGKLAEVAYRLLYIKANHIDVYPPQNVTPTVPDNNNPMGAYVLTVSIKDMAFNKSEMTIGLGTEVKWLNNDMVQHSVISNSGTELGSGLLSNDDSYTHTFNTVGTFSYHCGVHPGMTGTITVKPANQVPTI
jgi:plastocyanin